MKAIFAGTFDPFTLGHRDIVQRAASIFGEVIVAVAEMTGKNCVPTEKRVEIARLATADMPGVTVEPFYGLLTDYAAQKGDHVIVRGIRSCADFEYERDLTRVYASLGDGKCVCVIASPEVEHVSSTVVRSLAAAGASLDGYAFGNTKEIISEVYGKH